MLMDFMGGIVMINDGNVILREVMEIEIVLFYLFLLYWELIFLNVFLNFMCDYLFCFLFR